MPGDLAAVDSAVVFQSAPGREAGRCSLRLALSLPCARFNPRPAVRPGDAVVGQPPNMLHLFQSAPGREAGRCARRCIDRYNTLMFQSAPGREAGRCRVHDLVRGANPRFNPRPAVRPGDARPDPCGCRRQCPVSIRARP